MTDAERIARLNALIGVALDPALALECLRTGSYVYERSQTPSRESLRSNERLEFLGDAVLGFVVARHAWEHFPEAAEGELTRLRASLVRTESLGLAARALGLGELLLLGRGEERNGGRENPTRLADALEAVFAAVYLSRGVEEARAVIERVLQPLFAQTDALGRDPKTELQQLLQARRRSASYQVLSTSGPDHARNFEVEVRVESAPIGRGAGRTKKDAEQAAARAALEQRASVERLLLDEPIQLVAHDPRWAALAADEIARVRGALPGALVEHVGSTAVPDLLAVPVIDLAVLGEVARVVDYEPAGPGRFRKRVAGGQPFNVLALDRASFDRAVRLREYLRAHPDAVREYSARKRDAFAGTLNAYEDALAGYRDALFRRAVP